MVPRARRPFEHTRAPKRREERETRQKIAKGHRDGIIIGPEVFQRELCRTVPNYRAMSRVGPPGHNILHYIIYSFENVALWSQQNGKQFIVRAKLCFGHCKGD